MHGHIGELKCPLRTHRDTGVSYDNRAAFVDICRRTAGGGIDYDFYRARARKHRARVMRRVLRRLAPMLRVLIAAAIVLATTWVVLT